VRLFAVCLSLSIVAACGGDPEETVAVFTSDVVQRESCRVTGEEGREVCTRDVSTQRLRVTLVEDAFERAWLTGIQRDGQPERTILGSRDTLDGWMFEEETVQTNSASSCVRTDDVLLVLRLEDGITEGDVNPDGCDALVGRETRITTTSPECDEINDPPQQVQRIVRRRWEEAAGCRSSD
jgi:hypothetical protein